MTETRFGTFDELMEGLEPSIESICRGLRDLVLEVDPKTVEVVRLGDRAATYGVGPKKMSEGYTYILPYTNWVNLGFYKGADLPDPEGLLEGTGAKMRHVKVQSLDDHEPAVLRQYVKAALDERREALGLGDLSG